MKEISAQAVNAPDRVEKKMKENGKENYENERK